MDAVPFVIATKGAKVRNPVEQYDMLRSFREFLQWRQGNRADSLCSARAIPSFPRRVFLYHGTVT
jgi:maltose alpha-D-glucosyltransferase / alpha-amylase